MAIDQDKKDLYVKITSLEAALKKSNNELKKTQKMARQREDRYQRMVESVSNGITIIEAGKVVYVNERALKIFGYPRDEYVKMTGLDFAVPEEKERIKKITEAVRAKKEEIYELEYWINTKNGERRCVNNKYSFAKKNNKITHRFIITTDVTRRKNDEAKIKASEEKYRTMFEGINDALFLVELSPHGRILEVNNAACKLLGYKKTELKKLTIKDITTSAITEEEFTVFKKNKKHVIIKEYIRKDGTHIPVELNGSVVKYGDKEVVLTLARNIAKRKANEQKIIEQSKYNALRAKIWKVAANKSLDENQLIQNVLKLIGPELDVSRTCYNYVDGENQECLFEWCDEGVKPSVGSKMPNFILKHLMNDRIFELTIDQVLQQLPKSARSFARPVLLGLQRSLNLDNVIFIPYYINGILEGSISIDVCKDRKKKTEWTADKKELILEMVQILSGTIEQKRIEKALRKSEEKYRDLGELLPQTIFEMDTKGNFIYANQYGLNFFGYTQRDLQKGVNVTDILVKKEKARALKNIQMVIDSGEIHSFEYLMKTKNNVEFPGLVYSRPIVQDNSITGIRGIVIDQTEQKKNEKEYIEAKKKAEESDKLKSSFLANMSHEIRTPVNAILGMSDLLNEEDISTEEKIQYTRIIRERGTDLLHIINDIIDISKIEADQINIEPESCSVNSIIYELYSYYNAERERNNKDNLKILTKVPFDDADSFIYADSTRLKQVLSNLLSNALKYTDEGYIEIGYKKQKDEIQFYVKDTGMGIAKDMQSIIFERFRQVDDSDTRPFGGTGLGLSISRRLVEIMGGAINVSSEPGIGSIFSFYIPYVPAQQLFGADKTKNSFVLGEKNWQDKKILIVEDDNFSFQYLEAILTPTKVQILHAIDGKTAIELCEKQKDLNLVLMDIQLPGKDGLTATKEIKKINKKLPVIAQTAYAMEEDRARSFKAGCSDYISKPVDKRTILSIINKHIK